MIDKSPTAEDGSGKKTYTRRNFPAHGLEEALRVAQKIRDEAAGRPMRRLLLAHALDIKPSSSNFFGLLSSSFKYGLTLGSEKAIEVALTPLGSDATSDDKVRRDRARRQAVLEPDLFRTFYQNYAENKLPSGDMMKKILVSEYGVAPERAGECADLIQENGKLVGIVRSISGSICVLLDGQDAEDVGDLREEDALAAPEEVEVDGVGDDVDGQTTVVAAETQDKSKPIFIGHGKNRGPLEKLRKIRSSFEIPCKVVADEPQLGRLIPKKVREVMAQCGSAILIFTRDKKTTGEDGEEEWHPSENVIFELGAASYAYEDRVVIFMEEGLHFPTNFESVGRINFHEDAIEAKTAELLRELIGFKLVKLTPA